MANSSYGLSAPASVRCGRKPAKYSSGVALVMLLIGSSFINDTSMLDSYTTSRPKPSRATNALKSPARLATSKRQDMFPLLLLPEFLFPFLFLFLFLFLFPLLFPFSFCTSEGPKPPPAPELYEMAVNEIPTANKRRKARTYFIFVQPHSLSITSVPRLKPDVALPGH